MIQIGKEVVAIVMIMLLMLLGLVSFMVWRYGIELLICGTAIAIARVLNMEAVDRKRKEMIRRYKQPALPPGPKRS